MNGNGSGVRRSARLSTRKRHCSKSESDLACCFENHSPSPKSRKQETSPKSRKQVLEETEGSKSKTSLRRAFKAPRVLVGRLPASERRPVLQLVQMPGLVLSRITHFLDVTSLENLAATCDFLHQFVTLRGVTTLNIPFSNKFIVSKNVPQKASVPSPELEGGRHQCP